MSSFLRSARIFRSVRSITSTLHLATKPQQAICHAKPPSVVLARCFSVQPTSQPNNRQAFSSELEPLLHKLDNEGHRFGSISVTLVKKILSVVQRRAGLSSSQALLVLRCCGSMMPEEVPAARTELAHNIWSTLERKEVEVDLSHYNALLRVYLENEHNFSPLDFLGRLQEKGLEPNRVTYQRLVARYAQLGDIEGASKILEFMKEKNIAINETIFNSLILGHSRANDLQSAVDMLEVMRNSGLEPSVDTYSALAVAQAEKGDMEGIKSTIDMSKEKRQALHDRDLLEVVFALAVNGHKDLVPEVLSMIQKDWGYNQDCRSMVYRLLNADCDAEARLTYATMETLSEQYSQSSLNIGAFYVKHLILRDRPVDVIVSMCNELSGNSPHMLLKGLDMALTSNANLVYPIMDALVQKGEELRPHYFWPQLAMCKANNDVDGVCVVLQNMRSREVPITSQTLVDYVFPCLLEGQPKGAQNQLKAIVRLRDAGVPIRDSVNAVIKINLMNNDLTSSVEILRQFLFSLSPQLRRPLVTALCNTNAHEEAAIVLGQIAWTGRQQQDQQDEDKVDPEAATLQEDASLEDKPDVRRGNEDTVGRVLLDLAYKITTNNHSVDLVAFLQAVQQRGLSISRQSESAIAHRLGSLATPEVNALLDTLASGSLTVVELERGPRKGYFMTQSASMLESRLKEHEAENKDTTRILTNLLVSYSKEKNVEKAEETMQKLKDAQVPIGLGLQVVVMDMYCSLGLTQKALDLFKSIYTSQPDASLLPSKCLKVCRRLLEDGRIDEAVEIMNLWGKCRAAAAGTSNAQGDAEEVESEQGSSQNFNENFIDMTCGMMLQELSDKGDLENVQRVVDTIIANKLALPSRQLLSPIVNAHVAKNDIEGAMQALARFSKEHKLMPSKQTVMCALIKLEDTDKLRQVVDMSTEVHGEGNSLLDLAMAFIEEGRYNEARRIFETPGLRLSQNRLNYLCEILGKQKKVQSLNALLLATAPVFGIDRRSLYQQALQAYINAKDCDNALGLWTQMQGEDVTITDQFLYKLGQFLKANGREVPFVIPVSSSAPVTAARPNLRRENVSAATPVPPTLADKRRITEEQFPLLKEYRQIVKTAPLEDVIAFHDKLVNDPELTLYTSDTLNLVERLLDEKRLSDAVDVVKKVTGFRGRSFKRLNTLWRMLAQSAEVGDMETILYFLNKSPVEKRGVFGQPLCRAAMQSNRFDECLAYYEELLQAADTSTPAGLTACSSALPKPGLLNFLHKDESLLPKVEDLADKYKAKGAFSGQAVLWAYHFTKGNAEKANQLKQELKSVDYKLPHIALCNLMRDTEDFSLAPRILQELQDNQDMTAPFATTSVYNAWIDLHCQQKQPKQGLQVLESFLQRDDISSLNFTTLLNLRTALEAENIPFPHSLPERTRKAKPESSSSSSSDSD